MTTTIDLVEPFYGGSHRAWADGWAARSRHEIRLFTLPAERWRSRMRGAAISLAPQLVTRAQSVRPELVVASDMIDLADLIALTRETHHHVPFVLYLHENQLTYPRRTGEALDLGLAWTTWRNLVVADEVWCNSAFHRDDLLGSLPAFLDSMAVSDHRPLLDRLVEKMRVLPVGVDLISPAARSSCESPLILANHRWHHDNDVGALVRAFVWLADEGVAFRVAVVGDHEGGEAAVIDPLLDRLGERVVARGMQPRAAYEALLASADIVVSAARNEFFGVSVVEAVGAGAFPVLPNALAYPETMPAEFHDVALFDPGMLRPALAAAVRDIDARRAGAAGLAEAMRAFEWPVVAPRYDAAVDQLLDEPWPRAD